MAAACPLLSQFEPRHGGDGGKGNSMALRAVRYTTSIAQTSQCDVGEAEAAELAALQAVHFTTNIAQTSQCDVDEIEAVELAAFAGDACSAVPKSTQAPGIPKTSRAADK
eukprot:1159792-Pelagomonas_calceolata.AAC.16